ncbi:MAG: hypothetical protein OQJ78_05785 [Ignavibacteriaceae bacterium]|nr:hypothetical protein [Ignavibacteriaceae bacterium]
MKENFYVRSQNAENVDWSKIRYFKKEEFPLDELCLLSRYVVEELEKVRDALGVPITISPAEGAVVRHDDFGKRLNKKSYHFFCHETGRLGQAVDVFLGSLIPFVSPMQIITRVLGCSRFRGLGFYFDTHLGKERSLMLHLDLRHDPLVFYAHKPENAKGVKSKRVYFYPKTTDHFMKKLESLFFELKIEDMSEDEICLRPKGLPEHHEMV